MSRVERAGHPPPLLRVPLGVRRLPARQTVERRVHCLPGGRALVISVHARGLRTVTAHAHHPHAVGERAFPGPPGELQLGEPQATGVPDASPQLCSRPVAVHRRRGGMERPGRGRGRGQWCARQAVGVSSSRSIRPSVMREERCNADPAAGVRAGRPEPGGAVATLDSRLARSLCKHRNPTDVVRASFAWPYTMSASCRDIVAP